MSSSGNPSDCFFAFLGVVNHVTLWFQRENGLFASFDTSECVKPCYYDGKHDHLKIVSIIATMFDPGLNLPEHERRPVLENQLPNPEEESETQYSEKERSTFVTTEKKNWLLNPARFSKWYRVSSKGQLETGHSLVRVRNWVKRFIKNCRAPNEQRIKGELMANELADTELDIIKGAQREDFKEEIIPLTARKELSKRSHLLPLVPMLDGGLLRSNTRLRRSEDLRLTPSSRLFCQRNIT